MKKKFMSLLAMLVCALTLASCGGPEILAIMPAYKGKEITDTSHEFTNEEFYVLATYDDGTQAEVKDFKMEQKGMKDGYFIIEFNVDGFTDEAYVPVHLHIYPSQDQD